MAVRSRRRPGSGTSVCRACAVTATGRTRRPSSVPSRTPGLAVPVWSCGRAPQITAWTCRRRSSSTQRDAADAAWGDQHRGRHVRRRRPGRRAPAAAGRDRDPGLHRSPLSRTAPATAPRRGRHVDEVDPARTPGFNSSIGFSSGRPGSASAAARSGRARRVERQPRARSSTGPPESGTSWSAASCCCPARSGSRPERPTRRPGCYAAYSDDGLDGVSGRFHAWLRSRPATPAPTVHDRLLLNIWEAVYFDHDLERLTELADRAAPVGVERFVLDDGWFGHRRDDTAGPRRLVRRRRTCGRTACTRWSST